MATGAFNIAERTIGALGLHPNPAADRVRPTLPETWPFAQCEIRDGLGRIIREQRVEHGAFVDLNGIPTGLFELMVRHDDQRLRASLVVLP